MPRRVRPHATRAGSMCGWPARAPSSPLEGLRQPIGCNWRRERSSARRSCICTACCSPPGPLFLLLQTTFAARGRVGPSSRLGPAGRLARDGHGVCRLRGRERRPGGQVGGGLWRPGARLSHRVDVDDHALRRVRLRRHRLRHAARGPQAADAAGDDLDAPSGDCATVLCRERRDGSLASVRVSGRPDRWSPCWPRRSSPMP